VTRRTSHAGSMQPMWRGWFSSSENSNTATTPTSTSTSTKLQPWQPCSHNWSNISEVRKFVKNGICAPCLSYHPANNVNALKVKKNNNKRIHKICKDTQKQTSPHLKHILQLKSDTLLFQPLFKFSLTFIYILYHRRHNPCIFHPSFSSFQEMCHLNLLWCTIVIILFVPSFSLISDIAIFGLKKDVKLQLSVILVSLSLSQLITCEPMLLYITYPPNYSPFRSKKCHSFFTSQVSLPCNIAYNFCISSLL